MAGSISNSEMEIFQQAVLGRERPLTGSSEKNPVPVMTGLCGLGISLTIYLAALSAFSEAGLLCSLVGSDCLGAVHSAFGRTLGFSVASLGLGYFTFQLILTMLIARSTARAALLSQVQLLCAFGAMGASLFFAYVLRFILQQGCVACYGVHAINAAVLALSLFRHLRSGGRAADFFPALLRRRRELVYGLAVPILLAANVTLLAGFLETQALLQREQAKIRNNLEYYRHLYQTSRVHSFDVAPGDLVIGEPAIALHEVVLFYKQGCAHCRAAKERLTELVQKHDTAVYLLMKDAERVSPATLQELQVHQVPAIFIDGRFAEGWQVDGFLDPFVEDCGC